MLKTTKLGRCHDCAQGMFAPVDSGFAFYEDDDGCGGFWYCRYCGSNHVDITDSEADGVITQGNLYE